MGRGFFVLVHPITYLTRLPLEHSTNHPQEPDK
jgi:hypothetical protein